MTPQPVILAFIDAQRAEGRAVESILKVLHQPGLEIAARIYCAWKTWKTRKKPGQVAAIRSITDAHVLDAVRTAVWTADPLGHRKMTALVRRSSPGASPGSVDRAMRGLGLRGVRRSKGIRTTIPGKDGMRAGDLLNRDSTAPAPDRTWVLKQCGGPPRTLPRLTR